MAGEEPRKIFSHARIKIIHCRIVRIILEKSYIIERCGGQQKLVESCVIH